MTSEEQKRLKQLEELLLAMNKKPLWKWFKDALTVLLSLAALVSTWKIFCFTSKAQETSNTINQNIQFANILFTHYVGQKSCNKQQQVELYLAKKFTDSFDEGKTMESRNNKLPI